MQCSSSAEERGTKDLRAHHTWGTVCETTARVHPSVIKHPSPTQPQESGRTRVPWRPRGSLVGAPQHPRSRRCGARPRTSRHRRGASGTSSGGCCCLGTPASARRPITPSRRPTPAPSSPPSPRRRAAPTRGRRSRLRRRGRGTVSRERPPPNRFWFWSAPSPPIGLRSGRRGMGFCPFGGLCGRETQKSGGRNRGRSGGCRLIARRNHHSFTSLRRKEDGDGLRRGRRRDGFSIVVGLMGQCRSSDTVS